MYQVSIKEKSELELIAKPRRRSQHWQRRGAARQLTMNCQFTPWQPHQLQSHQPSWQSQYFAGRCWQVLLWLPARWRLRHRCCVLGSLTECLKTRSAHHQVPLWSDEVPQQRGSQESSVPCRATRLPPLKITHEYKVVSQSRLVCISCKMTENPLHPFDGQK